MKIDTIHEEVLQYLLSIHKNNEDFKFGVRKINRDSKLEKGYWFLGNENYLAIPFWSGTDLKSKVPLISLNIHKDGTTTFEINDGGHVLEELGIKNQIISKLSLPTSPDGYIRLVRSDFKTSYLDSLKSFIQNEKLNIDLILKENRKLIDHFSSYHFGFIGNEEFDKSIQRINQYRNHITLKKIKYATIKSLKISDFKNIRELKVNIPKDCKWIFITGENGSGKTSFLQALAIGICRNRDKIEAIMPKCKIEVTLHNDVRYPSTKEIDKNLSSKAFLSKGFAAYGPVRLFSESTSIKGVEFDKNISNDLTFGLFNSITLLHDLSKRILFNVRMKYQEMVRQDFLENISLNLPLIVPNIDSVEFENETDGGSQIFYIQANSPLNSNKSNKKVKFNELPSGTRNFVGIILDLLIKLQFQQPDVTDIANYYGIVIIDEIDLHLHPKMQKEIVTQLSQTFPNIQFVVTTHSPIPLLGAPENSIFVKMDKDAENNILAEILDIDIKNLLPNTLLTSPIFGFDQLTSSQHLPTERLYTEEDYTDIVFRSVLEKKLNDLLPEELKKNDSSSL